MYMSTNNAAGSKPHAVQGSPTGHAEIMDHGRCRMKPDKSVIDLVSGEVHHVNHALFFISWLELPFKK